MNAPGREGVGDRDRQVRVATGDVVALVGGAIDRPGAGAGLVAEEVDQVKRGLAGRLGAVLLVVGGVEQRPQLRAVAARDVVCDPVVHRHLVEELTRRRIAVVERRKPGRLHLPLQRVVHRLEIVARLRVRVLSAEDPVTVGRPVRLRLEQVDRRQIESPRELEDRLVVGIDQLAAQLRLLPVRPEAVTELLPVGVHPPAHTPRRLIDIGVDPLVLEGQGRHQPGDAAADDGDPRRGRRPKRAAERQRPCHRRDRPGCTGPLEELPSRQP